ncbi:hypothetical protein AHAS_Ahas02G0085300 [Arachis hypogaea]
MLPSLGQLPSLKSLRIRGLDQVRSIGEKFYKNEGDHHSSHIAPFPSLETLEEMLNQVFFTIVSSLSDVSKVRKLYLPRDVALRHSQAMFLYGDTLRIRGSDFVRESALKAMISMNHRRCLQEIDILGCSHVSFPGNCFQQQQHKRRTGCTQLDSSRDIWLPKHLQVASGWFAD